MIIVERVEAQGTNHGSFLLACSHNDSLFLGRQVKLARTRTDGIYVLAATTTRNPVA
jgi:hypothetical protein